jgi:hypothetical protein
MALRHQRTPLAAAPPLAAALQWTRIGLGVTYLMFPALAARAAGDQGHRATATVVARILGARHLIQAAATAGQPAGAVLALGAEADAAHAASMLAVGLISRSWRRAALRDCLLAAALAAAGAAAARRAPARAALSSPRNRLATRLARRLAPRYLTGQR